MTTKPLIGVNGEYRVGRKDTATLSWYNSGYYDSVTAARPGMTPGGLPILIPPLADDEDLKEFLSILDGVLLCGCSFDLDPVRLGMQKHPATRPMPNRREDFDRRLCKMAVHMRMPVLAIGAGMQALNVACGGTLLQHIPEEVPQSLLHRDPVEATLRHVLEIVPGTKVDDIYGPGEIRVNSQHHMACDQVASLFRVSATASDGVIEAYESMDDDWFCLGVQWHPENETASALDTQIFETFLSACSKSTPVTIPMFKKAA